MEISKNKDMQNEFDRCREDIDKRLGEIIAVDNVSYAKLLESMRYSVLAGGKRSRSVMCIKFCEAAGGNPQNAYDAACAIEMMHTYALIHDDLPCMDNSALRRGKPSSHIKYGEFTAILAGDALQAAAFETLAGCTLPPETIVEMVRILADTGGPDGICGGQYLDLQGVWQLLTEDLLNEIHKLKTASLMAAAAKIGVLAAGGSKEQVKAAEDYALAVGFAFQVRDDVLDSTAKEHELGKPLGSDLENNKMTYATLLGIDKCEQLIRAETEAAIESLQGKFDDTSFLEWLARILAERKS